MTIQLCSVIKANDMMCEFYLTDIIIIVTMLQYTKLPYQKQRCFNMQKENRFCDYHMKLTLVSNIKYLFSKLQSIVLILF